MAARLRKALKDGDLADIKAKQEALTTAMNAAAQDIYAAGGAQPGAEAGAPPPQDDATDSASSKKADDTVVDADFEMMDDQKKK